ncbi:hypothetical protein COB47_0919 [Caldicellulosiruptor obsidiansis OB47]|uniref:Uncharacterized protein n=1 Tax=Caldicellulosiruptor obsidiansis (strain ATCC BAA-2073 / JCM 16842 / OB47) TaxID=608506 RepID=D9TJP4_CALOO|nr:hypothetical protein [Caldicellulosiruptor obsidiansis]ADL42226.1 hypothetical protein COB47_0919 [Caldicellulosiruptor obsidiansis OB47]
MKNSKTAIKEKIEQIVEYFRAQDEGKAYTTLIELIDVLMEYYTNENNQKESDIEMLRELLTAMKNRDTVLIADILEYELKEKFQ